MTFDSFTKVTLIGTNVIASLFAGEGVMKTKGGKAPRVFAQNIVV